MELDAYYDRKVQETWDRLTLLLIARPCEGHEAEFAEITRREIDRLKFSNAEDLDE